MSMGVIIIAIIVIVVIGLGAAVTLRREPDDSGKDEMSESATNGSDNPQWPEAQAREAWPPSPSPAAPMPTAPGPQEVATAPGPQEVATQGSEIRSDPAVRRSPNAESATRLWNDGTIHGYQDRWGKVQLQFIDDPQNAAVAAEALITDVVESLAATISAQKSTLDAWRSNNGADTEELRMVVRGYRDFLDRVLGA